VDNPDGAPKQRGVGKRGGMLYNRVFAQAALLIKRKTSPDAPYLHASGLVFSDWLCANYAAVPFF